MIGPCAVCARSAPLMKLGNSRVCISCAKEGTVDGDGSGRPVVILRTADGRQAVLETMPSGTSPKVYGETLARYRVLAKFWRAD